MKIFSKLTSGVIKQAMNLYKFTQNIEIPETYYKILDTNKINTTFETFYLSKTMDKLYYMKNMTYVKNRINIFDFMNSEYAVTCV